MNENLQEQKNIFEDVAREGIANTLQSLSKITSKKWKIIDHKMEFYDLQDMSDIFSSDEIKFGGELVYDGQTPMSFVCIFPKKSVADLTSYINSNARISKILQKMTIAEVSNILTNSFLGVVANNLKMSMLIAIPSVSVGSSAYLLKKAVIKSKVKSGYVLVSKIFVQSQDLSIESDFMVILSSSSLSKITRKMTAA